MRTLVAVLVSGAFAALASADDLNADSTLGTVPDVESSAYIAPVNQLIFKAVWPGGEIREFERDLSNPGTLRSTEGWSGRFFGEGGVEIRSGDGAVVYRFDRGRLRASIKGGVRKVYPYELKRDPPPDVVPPQLISKADTRAAAEAYAYQQTLHKWDGTGRLAFPFINPNQNGALYSEILLVCLGAALFFRRRALRLAFGTVGVLASACLVWTMSRGAWLGTFLGCLPFLFLYFRKLCGSRWIWTGAGVLAATIAAWLFLFGGDQIVRGFEAGGWTNAIRLEMWGNAPRMMFDAPDGWASFGVGAAYLHWYQPLHDFAHTPTLINHNLTWLAGWGCMGRFAYLLSAFLLLSASFVVFVNRRNPLPLAVWTGLGVAAWFNPMLHHRSLWVLPVLCSVLLLRDFPWRRMRVVLLTLLSGVLLATGAWSGLYFKGAADARRAEFVRAEGGRVWVHGPNPKVWIVDDGVLGGGLTGKDIREFYSVEHRAPAVGYVSSIADLPKDVDKLVLAGHAGAEWLTLLSDNESARAHLPKTVVFVSPPFSPVDIPEGVLKTCRVRILIGEFAARYDPGYANAPEWVTIVPGMEMYILRWMWAVMGA